jgi:hypothetical protein
LPPSDCQFCFSPGCSPASAKNLNNKTVSRAILPPTTLD